MRLSTITGTKYQLFVMNSSFIEEGCSLWSQQPLWLSFIVYTSRCYIGAQDQRSVAKTGFIFFDTG